LPTLFALVIVALSSGTSKAQQATLTDDSTYPAGVANNQTLLVQGASAVRGQPATSAFIKFKLTGSTSVQMGDLASGTPGADVKKATLRLFVAGVTAPGKFDVYRVTTSWAEDGTSAPTYDTNNPIATNVTVPAANSYLSLDITPLVKEWLDCESQAAGSGCGNYGLAFVPAASAPAMSFSFDTKESGKTSHQAQLGVLLNRVAFADTADALAATAKIQPNQINGQVASAAMADSAAAVTGTVNAGQISGALTNATIAGGSVTGNISAGQISGKVATAVTADSAGTVAVPLTLNGVQAGTGQGVVNVFNSAGGSAIVGWNNNASGGTGLYGRGRSSGVYGEGDVGVRGQSEFNAGFNGQGVFGSGSTGVHGYGASRGVFGDGAEYGMFGQSARTGVYGDGQIKGVHGRSTNATGVGLYGEGLNGATAGLFKGDVKIEGNLNVTGTTTATVANANHAATADSATSAGSANALAATATISGSQVSGKVASAATSDKATTADSAATVTGTVSASLVNGALTNATIDGSKISGDVNASTQYSIGGATVLKAPGSNIFVGSSAGSSNTTGSYNSFFGQDAGNKNTTGFENSFVGTSAGSSNTTGRQNSFVGQDAGNRNTMGVQNSFFGQGAGVSNTTESNNTFLGASSNGAAGITNATAVGYAAVVQQSNSVVLGNNASVGIGTAAPKAKLHVSGGKVYVEANGQGVILKSPSGTTCFELTVTETGALITTTVACPN